MVADVSVFVVPSIRRAERRNHIDLDALVGIRVDVADLLLRVEVADSHIPENALAPLGASLNRHHACQLIETHFFPVVPSDQVFPPQEELSRFLVVDSHLLVWLEVMPERLAKMPGSVAVMVSGDVEQSDGGYLLAYRDRVPKGHEPLPEYLRVPVVSRFDQGSLGRQFVGPVEVQEIVAYRQNDFLGIVGGDAVEHRIDRISVVACCDFEIVVIGSGLLRPAELAEVAVVQAEFDQVLRGSLASRFSRLTLRHPRYEREDAFLDRLGGLASELDCDLQVGDLPQCFDAVFVYDGLSLPGDFPAIDFVFSDFPNV